jgi:hypothetical protein
MSARTILLAALLTTGSVLALAPGASAGIGACYILPVFNVPYQSRCFFDAPQEDNQFPCEVGFDVSPYHPWLMGGAVVWWC